MKKLSKNINLTKESIEVYNVYAGCNCDCRSYCGNTSKSAYTNMKSLQSYNTVRED